MRIVEPESVGMSGERLRRIPRVMQGYVDRGEAAGIVTLVARRGAIAHLAAVGCRDVERGEPMSDEAICRIYSMTKPVTTVAALMLYEEGAFQLDDPLADYIPAFRDTPVLVAETPHGIETAPQERPLTVRHLMTHTAGLVYPSARRTWLAPARRWRTRWSGWRRCLWPSSREAPGSTAWPPTCWDAWWRFFPGGRWTSLWRSVSLGR